MRIMLLLMRMLHPHPLVLQLQQLARLHRPRDCHPDALREGVNERIVLSEAMADDADPGNDEDEDRNNRENPTEVGRPLGVVVAGRERGG